MQEFKGTGGVWSYSAALGEVKSDTEGLVAEMIVNGNEDQNGKLFASAPGLLEALVRLESWASTMHGHGVSYSGDHPIAKAKSAIAKALGQLPLQEREMRKVECKRWEFVGGKRTLKCVLNGVFHQWGAGYEEFETGPGNFTVAIVEMEDGEIKEFMPTDIKFIE